MSWSGRAGQTYPSSDHPPPTADVHLPHGLPPPAALRPPDAERRQLTVLFCDLVDSTALAGQLDPEDLREVVRAYQATCAEVIQRFDGHIAQYLGDGLLVYFGYPQAHEDDAQRAVRAGLGHGEALGTLNARLAPRRAASAWPCAWASIPGWWWWARWVAASRQEQLALGETPNMAARLQGLAAPDTVVISAATLRLVRGYCYVSGAGIARPQGRGAPAGRYYRTWRQARRRAASRSPTASGLTPWWGARRKWRCCGERWEQATEGHGQVVLLSGEAGIGKSRLVQKLRSTSGSGDERA